MLPHSYGKNCLACSTSEQRENGKYVRCSMKKPIELRPMEGKPNWIKEQTKHGSWRVLASNPARLIASKLDRGDAELIVSSVNLHAKLIEALEELINECEHQMNLNNKDKIVTLTGMRGLLQEAKGGTPSRRGR